MTCENCRLWTAPLGNGPYGFCKPSQQDFLPFWAVDRIPDQHTQTRRNEGEDCDAFAPRGSA